MKKNLSKLNLFLELFQKGQIPNCYLGIKYKDQDILKKLITVTNTNNLVYSHSLSPNYLEYYVNKKEYKIVKIKQANKGYAIDVGEFENLQTFLEVQMSRRTRKSIRQSMRGLETNCKVSYRMFGSDISQDEYNALFDELRIMLDDRFEEKNEADEKLSQWSEIKLDFYEALNRNKAAMLVIYNSDIPIGISLNYLVNNILFCWISAYNTNYAKFSLGYVNLYKVVEWSLENNYKLIEWGYGDHDYKIKWSNSVYNFEHHIIYKRNSFIGVLLGKFECSKVYTKEFLKHNGIVDCMKKIKSKLN
ncbi:GNAT family N-acetyltransferase [Algibacter amylolyticus]|uniref:GNAT family N-acetyltransferase n=1 Tax=Algibacter amylolyticus TaxID=1608400 RepID=A0A5M7BBC5_9FLAO|nr:GNAT family N-acetyltransferase [Algibacter amylolyticus]KAA5825638.1 GNAT family N-acetyltransferase [Algibacter amylolyticus]MBB5268133.1 putative N-acyltransferase [Algibacter amylolyticus]TSJ79936.1 GNAT family N-acetyltransferase [Algibacter amylolyticus]